MKLEIRHSVYIRRSREEVFDALTDGSFWSKWFTSRCVIGQAIGEPILFEWIDFGIDHTNISDRGKIIAWDRPATFGFSWKPGDSETAVQFSLTPRGNGTIVSLTESGYADSTNDFEAFKGCSVGWGEALTLFKFYIEHGITYGPIPKEDVKPLK